MNILLVSPLEFPVNQFTKYAGIEKLVWEYSKELTKQGHSVTVMGHEKSVFPERVTLLACPTNEVQSFQSYQSQIRTFDVIHDFSHLHLASRFMPNLPSLNIFWHAPHEAQYPKAPYNVIALSKWAAREFKRVYKQEVRYQRSICVDTTLYNISKRHRNERLLALARSGVEKGNLEAMTLARRLGMGIDVISARGVGMEDKPLTEYEQAMDDMADGNNSKVFHNSLPELEKIKYLQTNKALIYITIHPEVTSHKIQEAMLCGMPVIVPRLGALPEIVTDGIDGFLCRTEIEYVEAVQNVNKLIPSKTHKETIKRWGVAGIIKSYLPLYEEVANGLIWK